MKNARILFLVKSEFLGCNVKCTHESLVYTSQIWDGASVSGHLIHGDRVPQQLGQFHEISGPGNGHSRHSLRWIGPREEFLRYV